MLEHNFASCKYKEFLMCQFKVFVGGDKDKKKATGFIHLQIDILK